MDWKENPYNGKKVLVTGHTGFKGAWLIKILSMLGARVKGYALTPETSPNLYDVLKVEEIATSVIGDLMDAKRLSRKLQRLNLIYLSSGGSAYCSFVL